MENTKNTLLVNLYAGPGAGKSTGAAYIFAKLKMAGIDCEYVSEYAKDRVWQEDQFPLKHCQLYVTGKQCLKITRLIGKVDVIVTDSPIMLGAMYTTEQPHRDVCIYEGKKYRNTLNLFIDRRKTYNPNGRNQTFDEAREIDRRIIDMLDSNGITYSHIDGTEEGYDAVVKAIIDTLGYSENEPFVSMDRLDSFSDDHVEAAWKAYPSYDGYTGSTANTATDYARSSYGSATGGISPASGANVVTYGCDDYCSGYSASAVSAVVDMEKEYSDFLNTLKQNRIRL